MSKTYHLSFSEGESFYWNFELRDAAGIPLDLTGGLVEWAVTALDGSGTTLLASTANGLITMTSITEGLGTVNVSEAQHADIVDGEYTHELRATLASTVSSVQIKGKLTVGESIFPGIGTGFSRSSGLQLIYDSTTSDGDPGDGEFRFNQSSPASATFVYIDLLDRFNVSITNWIAALDDSTTTGTRGFLRFTKIGTESTWYEYAITGAITTATGYRKVPLSYVAGAGTPSNGDSFAVQFSRTGNIGSDGPSVSDGDKGDITVSGSGATWTIDENAVTNAKLDDVATATFKGRTTAGTGNPEDLTATQATALLDAMVGDSGAGGTKGLVPAPAAGDAAASKFLKADGTFAIPAAGPGGGAPDSADYLVKTANGSLSAERVVTDSTTMVADWSTAGQVKFNVVGGGSATVPTDFKDSVAVATTANITLSGEQTIDGVLTSASRVLVKDQSTGANNGIYVSDAGAWSRATDADTSAEVTPGMLVLVEGGTVNGDQVFILTTNGTITLGSTSLAFQAIAIPANVFVGKTVSGTTYTTVLTDSTKRLNATNAGTKTITIARQAVVNHAVNTEIEICNIGAGLLTIAPDTGVTLNSLSSILTVPQYHCVKAKKRATPNTWEITGVQYRIGTDVQAYDADLAVIAGLVDPNADRILFWDDSAGAYAYLTASTGLTISGTNITSNPVESFIVACSDETTALTTGTAKATFRMPYAFTVSDVRASVTTAPTGATLLTVDVNDSGTTILSTKLTFDASEKTTTTAATPRVISDTALADDAEITIDIDAVGSTIAGAGLKVYIIGTKT